MPATMEGAGSIAVHAGRPLRGWATDLTTEGPLRPLKALFCICCVVRQVSRFRADGHQPPTELPVDAQDDRLADAM